jgi:RimJ/RimL family protein N-acetyltransferase
MNEYIALPLTLTPMPKVSFILDRLVAHDSYWSDYQAGRREIAASLLTDTNNIVLEIWRKNDPTPEAQPVGLVMFTHITPYTDCQFHPIFFDGQLSNALGKRNILLSLLSWAFRALQVERVSAEIPEFAGPLIHYARKKLGFRFEAEGRSIERWTKGSRHRAEKVQQTPTAAQAALGSRKHRIVRYRGQWSDLILLSVTRDEFAAFVTSGPTAEESHDGRILSSTGTTTGNSAGPPGVSSGGDGAGLELADPTQ